MALTTRGRALLFGYSFRGVTRPTNYYMALVTSAVTPTAATKTLGTLTEITAGNGYTAGGYQLTPNTTDFDTLTENDTDDFSQVNLKNIAWTATGGNIPPSGSGARYAVLTTDEATQANRQVIAFFDLSSARTILSGLTLTLVDALMQIGGTLADIPTQFAQATANVTPGNGAKGSYAQLVAATAFRITEITINPTLISAVIPIKIDIATGAGGAEVVKIPDIDFEFDGVPMPVRFRIDIAAGTRLAARARSETGTTAFPVQIIYGGP